MIIIVFRSSLREESRAEPEIWSRAMDEMARQMSGFVSIKTFRADDGERVSIVGLCDWNSLINRAHPPRHVEAQRLGNEKFTGEFHLQSGHVERESHFPA